MARYMAMVRCIFQQEGNCSYYWVWSADGSFPKVVSILFANGDLYEGPLQNGMPTDKGTWTSGKERQAKLKK